MSGEKRIDLGQLMDEMPRQVIEPVSGPNCRGCGAKHHDDILDVASWEDRNAEAAAFLGERDMIDALWHALVDVDAELMQHPDFGRFVTYIAAGVGVVTSRAMIVARRRAMGELLEVLHGQQGDGVYVLELEKRKDAQA